MRGVGVREDEAGGSEWDGGSGVGGRLGEKDSQTKEGRGEWERRTGNKPEAVPWITDVCLESQQWNKNICRGSVRIL